MDVLFNEALCVLHCFLLEGSIVYLSGQILSFFLRRVIGQSRMS